MAELYFSADNMLLPQIIINLKAHKSYALFTLIATILINTRVLQVQEISNVTQKSCSADSFCPQRHLRQVLYAKSKT